MKTANRAVALICWGLGVFALISVGLQFASTQARAQTQNLDQLFVELQKAGPDDWEDVEKAIWTEWSKSGSRSMDFLLERGRAEMKKGNVRDAIGHFSALIDHAPTFAEGWNARATAFFLADRYGLSIADIRQTLVLEPRHFGALSGLGMIYERLDQPNKALAAFQAALAVHPNRPDALKAVERLKEAFGDLQ